MTATRFPTYLHLLGAIHARLRPRTYLEIGVQSGAALSLALPGTRCVGIDPQPNLRYRLSRQTTVFGLTSDEFFEQVDVPKVLGAPIDFAFVDGMHLSEFALRDLVNIAQHSHPGTLVLFHDCHPEDEAGASRQRTTTNWTGDVWRTIAVLRSRFPALRISTVDIAPTGLGVLHDLYSERLALRTSMAELIDAMHRLDYPADQSSIDDAIGLVPNNDDLRTVVPEAFGATHPLQDLTRYVRRAMTVRNAVATGKELRWRRMAARSSVG